MSDASVQESVSLESLVAGVADEFMERQRNGERPNVEAYAARHPEAADLLRKVLTALEVVGLSLPGSASLPDDELLGVLGDFRLLREVGRGGMGVVYEAEQISLRRRVALKVLPFAATMDPRHLQRFHNEAQAAACLHHTNIVPVFFVGCERGVHFYAMQFIDGQPLSHLIRQLRQAEKKVPASADEEPTIGYPSPLGDAASTPRPAAEITPWTSEGHRGRDYFRKVAELGVQAAEALDYAHQLGIVHRDIKPANLLLDGRANLWVTDFGLAHVRHGEANLTLSGQMVGTPRYMSPEQALAQRVVIDHRTDVYSLGATLYELLALRPVFAGEDRQELLQQIAFAEPARLRRCNKSIPAELETIVHKAIEKRPQDRYATAQELADDLRRWLDERPIRARRPSMLHRLRKWTRRHRPMVTGVVTAVVLTLATSAVLIAAAYQQERKHRKIAEDAQAEEQKQREQAEDQLYLADMQQASHLLAYPDMGRLRDILEAHRPREGQRDRRGWEWYYLRGLCDRELLTIQEDCGTTFVSGLSWLGKNRLQTVRSGCLKVWELNEESKTASIRWRRRETDELSAWSPDGARFACSKFSVGSPPVIQIEDGSGRVEASLPTSNLNGRMWVWSPDGSRLAAKAVDAGKPTKAGEVRPILTIWDVRTAKSLVTCRTTDPAPKTFIDDISNPNPLQWSPDGKWLAEGGEVLDGVPTVRIWNADSGQEVCLLRLKTENASASHQGDTVVNPAGHFKWSPDSKRLAVVHFSEFVGTKIRILDVLTGKRLFSLPGGTCLAWSPDGTSLAIPSATPRPAVVVWDAATGQERFTLRGHSCSGIDLVAWSPDGRRLASLDRLNAVIKVWDVTQRPDYTLVNDHADFVGSVAWNPDGKRLLSVADNDGTVKVWDWDQQKELFEVKGSQIAIGAVWSPEGQRLAVFCPTPVPGGGGTLGSSVTRWW